MANQPPWAPYIRMLVYPVMYSKEPSAEVDRILRGTLKDPADVLTAGRYLENVSAALASDADLSKIVTQDHPEPVIRDYLSKVEQALQKRLSK